MRLLYSALSPFARKVRVLALEKGLSDRIALEPAAPYQDEAVRSLNPLNKVPTLVTDHGEAVYDSAVICDYLDGLSEPRLIPAAQPERHRALTLEAAADGMGDAALLVVRERTRPAEEHRQDLFDRQLRAIAAALDLFDRAGLSTERFGIGEIAVAAQLGYLDARKVVDWREGRPSLTAWFEIASKRSSMIASDPSAN
ncbi:glutathione S-transferase N-terminal domain-containing protein [Caulobacter segnis]|uniref:glutathione S-transferase N-terminal domain-containing protein n=1 Tax=Caulobacter segnis TaxID=88688 RepID=UPI00285CE550|nr:glutathione S-transferase N-terminal domain-containing protein [Caulobacter segnis]MDR6624807.1 glutathione S-transferase [Caulobacter segnis]